MEKKTLSEALNQALEMEEKGYKFYKEASEKSENNVTKNTFNFLADNELLHIESIKKFYNALKEKEQLPSIILEGIKDKRSKELEIFSTSISELTEKIKPSDDDQKACEFAMEFENSGYRYYEGMLKEAKDLNLIEFLKFLVEEENKHYESLMKLHTYLTDSHNWFMYDEGSFSQGG